MGQREGLLFIFLLAVSWTSANARKLINQPMDYKIPSQSKIVETVGRNEQLCTLCEQFTKATYYLHENMTEAEIIDTLHHTCSRLHSFEEECVILVDHYASLFFVEIAEIQPEEFCKKVNLCEKAVFLSLPKRNDSCTVCHHAVDEVLTKLKDPDTQLGIIELLLKQCSKMGQHVQECKRLVFQYGPLILANGEKFLETKDVCVTIHACQAGQEAAVEQQ